MTKTPNPPASIPTPELKPVFSRVAQTNDFDCSLACIGTVTAKTVAEVKQLAIDKFEVPAHGPWWFSSEDLIRGLLGHLGWRATAWREATSISQLPEVSIVLIDYNTVAELGRHAVVHVPRAPGASPYLIDVGFWVEPARQIRGIKELRPPLWFIGVEPMKPPTK